MAQTGVMPDTLTDDQMQALLSKQAKPTAMPDTLTDDQMAALMQQNTPNQAPSGKPDAKDGPKAERPKEAKNSLPEGIVEWKSAGGQKLRMHQDLTDPFMQADQEFFEATGKHIKVNSSFRTKEEQQKLYDELKPKGAKVATPGHSQHELGRALDIGNWKEAEPYLRAHGFENPFGDDKNHFQIKAQIGETEKAVRKAAFGAIPGGPILNEALPESHEAARKAAPYTKTILPFAGATAGGIVAAPANLGLPGVAEVAGVAGGGAIGSQLQRMLEQYGGIEQAPTKGEQFYGKTFGPIVDAGTDVAMMLAMGPLGSEALPGMRVLNNPAVKTEAEAAAGTLGRKILSEETGVPLTPAQIGKAKSTTYLEAQLRKNMWSADEVAAFDAEQQQALQDYAQKVQKTEFKGRNDPASAGEVAKDSAWNRIKAFRKRGGQLYDQVPVKPNTPVETNGMASAATEHLEELGKMESPTIKRILGIAQKSETPATVKTSPIVDEFGRPINTETPSKPAYTWQELRSDISELGKMSNAEKDYGRKRIYNDLIRGANNDIAVFAESVDNPEIKKQLELANKYWRHGDSIFGPIRTGVDFPGMKDFGRKSIRKLMKEESTEKIGRQFFKASPNASDIRALREVAGENAFNEIRQSWFEDMITKGEDQSFSHNRFITAYDKYKMSGNLDEMLTKSQREGLDKLYEISRLVAWSEKAAGNPSGTGAMNLNNLMKWVRHPVYAAIEARGAKDLAKNYFNNPEFQKKLVYGLKLPAASPKAKVAARSLLRSAGLYEREEER